MYFWGWQVTDSVGNGPANPSGAGAPEKCALKLGGPYNLTKAQVGEAYFPKSNRDFFRKAPKNIVPKILSEGVLLLELLLPRGRRGGLLLELLLLLPKSTRSSPT